MKKYARRTLIPGVPGALTKCSFACCALPTPSSGADTRWEGLSPPEADELLNGHPAGADKAAQRALGNFFMVRD